MKPILPVTRKKEKGQILVILALVFIGLVAIVGLAIDLGNMYVNYARLRRAVDAAALSATSQFKKNVTTDTLQKSAREFLVLNGVPDTTSTNALIDTCTTKPGDPALCTDPPRKLVRITASQQVPMFFMSVVGIPSVPISVTSISEAAAVDLVLVIDRSESMGWYKPDLVTRYGHVLAADPVQCNSKHPDPAVSNVPDNNPGNWTGDCHPFHEVKAAAFNFIDTFMDPNYDRIAIVVFDQIGRPVDFSGGGPTPVYLFGKSNNPAPLPGLEDAVRHLWMYDGFHDTGGGKDDRSPIDYTLQGLKCPFYQGDVPPADFPLCRLTDSSGGFFYLECQGTYTSPPDWSNCGTTNMGSGLSWASYILQTQGRESSLWVTILLTDGIPNIGLDKNKKNICPPSERIRDPWCMDKDPNSRHTFDPSTNEFYDTNDYTRDQADILADGVHSTIFSIGVGSEVTSLNYSDAGLPAQGATLLNYIANKGGTQNYYQGEATQLRQIFLAIANKIATRLTK